MLCSRKRDACWKVGTGWVREPEQQQRRNVLNLLCQLNSLREVADLWHRHAAAGGLQYRSVIFLRPDVLYMDPLPVESILSIKVCPGPAAVGGWLWRRGSTPRRGGAVSCVDHGGGLAAAAAGPATLQVALSLR